MKTTQLETILKNLAKIWVIYDRVLDISGGIYFDTTNLFSDSGQN